MEQQMRYSDKELEVIKNTFAGSDNDLKKLRAFFLQKGEAPKLSKASLEVVRKTFLPEIDLKAPIHQVIDLYLTMDLKDKSPEEAHIVISARQLIIDYFDALLSTAEGNKKETVNFDDLVKGDENETQTLINMLARNTIVNHTEQCLMQLKVLAGSQEETVEETKERLKQNSNK